jgi:microcystin degradation protein MlrC
MRAAKASEALDGVLSTSAFLVHPYLDQPNMGSGVLVITNDDMDRAIHLAKQLTEQFWELRFDFEPEVDTPERAIEKGLKVDGGPVLLVETSDCCGGGAAGDSVASLRALLDAMDAGVTQPALVPVVDPDAAAACHRAGLGKELMVDLAIVSILSGAARYL